VDLLSSEPVLSAWLESFVAACRASSATANPENDSKPGYPPGFVVFAKRAQRLSTCHKRKRQKPEGLWRFHHDNLAV
jgi:hypothetical protein